jgi:hypothetical protein
VVDNDPSDAVIDAYASPNQSTYDAPRRSNVTVNVPVDVGVTVTDDGDTDTGTPDGVRTDPIDAVNVPPSGSCTLTLNYADEPSSIGPKYNSPCVRRPTITG